MRTGHPENRPVSADPASPDERAAVRDRVRVLEEIRLATARGDADLVKRLAKLL